MADCRGPQDWKWSSARAHIKGRDERLVRAKPLLERVDDWGECLWVSEEGRDEFRRSEHTGRPLGSADFIAGLEQALGRALRGLSPGRKGKRLRN